MRSLSLHRLAMIACAILPSYTNAQALDRTKPPSLGAPKRLTLPAMNERVLPNGLRLVVVERRELPVVDLLLLVGAGSDVEPAGKGGLATLVANLLDEGANGRSTLDLAEQVAFLGARLGTGASFDRATLSLHTPVAVLDSALTLLADVTLRPAFDDREFTRLRNERLTGLLQEKDRGPAMADRAFAAITFGDNHPYGHSLNGTQPEAEALTRDDVVAFWRGWYRPNNATLVIVGDVSVSGALEKATRLFGGWARGALSARPTVVTPTAPAGARIFVVDKPAAAQSSFRVGGIGVARSTPDYYPLQVMNTVLGGSFTSRLNNNLRETKGYSYGASSNFAMRRHVGAWIAGGEIVSAKSDSALLEILKELSAIREVVPAAELEKAKRYLTLGYADRFESTGDVANGIAAVATLGIPLRELGRYQARIDAVSAVDVQRVSRRYIDPSRLTVVIAGDRKSLVPALEALKVAPVEVRDMYGKPGVTP